MKALAAGFAALAMAAPQAAAKPGHDGPLMGIVVRGHTQYLTALDPVTLEPAARGVVIGRESVRVVARSPEGKRLAVISGRDFSVFDAARGRLTRSILVGDSVVAAVWTRPNRIALLDTDGGVHSVTLGRRTTLRWHPFDGEVVSWTATRTQLVALLAPSGRIGPAKLAVADDAGNVRIGDLPGVTAGRAMPEDGAQTLRMATPGLAADPSGTRVVVASNVGAPLVVNLATLTVGGRSLAAARKLVSGYTRLAIWFAPDLVAVTGADAAGEELWTPAGLTVFDLSDGTSRRVAEGVFHALLAGQALLACGAGVSAYDGTGRAMFHTLGAETITNVSTAGRFAYATSDGRSYRVFDLETGDVVATATPLQATTIVGLW